MTPEAAAYEATLARLLRAELETVRFRLDRESYSAAELQKLYETRPHPLYRHLGANVTADAANRINELLSSYFASLGVDQEKVSLSSSVCPSFVPTTSPLGLVQVALTGAAILGSKKAAAIVSGWLHGDRLGYVSSYVLPDVKLPREAEDPYCLGYGTRIRRFGESERASTIRYLGQDAVNGLPNSDEASLVEIECRGRPALYLRGEDDPYDDERLNLVKGEVLLSVMSLEANRFIGESHTWKNYGDLAALVKFLPRTADRISQAVQPVPVSQVRLRRIRRSWQGVFRNVDLETVPAWYYFVPAPGELRRPFLATRRWRKAARTYEGLLEDNFIELRVVLDLLLSEAGERNIGRKRLAERATSWLGQVGVKGQTTYECVSSLYRTASEVLHAGSFQSVQERAELAREYDRGLAITRKLLRKGLTYGFKDWT